MGGGWGGGWGGVEYGWHSFCGSMGNAMGKGSSYIYGITKMSYTCMHDSLGLKPVARII